MFGINRYCAAYSQSIYLSFKVKKRKFKAKCMHENVIFTFFKYNKISICT